MLINELLNLEERINLAKLIQKYKSRAPKPKAKTAAAKWPKIPATPKHQVSLKAKPISPPRSPKPFNITKGEGKAVGPKQTRTLATNPNMEVNSFLKPLSQNVINPRDSVDMNLYRKMEFVKNQTQINGIDSKMSNREIDSKSRGS